MKASYIKPLLPLRDIVIFPSMVVPLFVGREKSIKALQEAMKSDKSIVLITQKNSEIDDPLNKDLYQYGCLSKVLQLLKLPDGTVKVLVEGEKRVKIVKHGEEAGQFLTCEVEIVDDQKEKDKKELEQFAIGLVKKFERLQILNKKELNDTTTNLKNLKDPYLIQFEHLCLHFHQIYFHQLSQNNQKQPDLRLLPFHFPFYLQIFYFEMQFLLIFLQ